MISSRVAGDRPTFSVPPHPGPPLWVARGALLVSCQDRVRLTAAAAAAGGGASADAGRAPSDNMPKRAEKDGGGSDQLLSDS